METVANRINAAVRGGEIIQPVNQVPTRTRTIATTSWSHQGYRQRLWNAGANVFTVNEGTRLKEIDNCDGLLIPGGRDVGTCWYGEEEGPMTQSPDLQRDSLEMALIKHCLNKDIPILGVCRGHQLLNVAMGGTLHQHIHGHEGYRHRVWINPASKKLAFIYDDDDPIVVNSLHHQSVNELGKGLIAAAADVNSGIEAVESTEHSWVVGVQWHPEMACTPRFDRTMGMLVKQFIFARK